MNKHHTIEEQHFELRFSNELDAFEQQETLEVFVKQRLLPIVDSVFDEVSGPEQLMRIDSITLDLGSVPYDDYEAETERRLREQLKNELLAYKLQIKEEPTSLVSSVSPQDSELELLEYFLNTGCLPWSGGSGADIDLERQLQDLLEKQPQALKTLLKAAGKREIGVRRLVKQFSIAQLELLLGLFAPKRSQAAINLYRDFRNLLQARDMFAIPEHQLNDLVWTELLTRAIQSGPSLAVNDSLLQHWLARLSELVEHSYSSLLGMLLETARKQVDRKEVSIEIRGILQRLDVTKVKDSTHRQPVSEQSATQTKLTHTEDLDDSKFTFTVNGYHHYLILKRRLIDATILQEADSSRLTVGIKRLEQYAPWLLLRLAQEIKTQPGFGLHNFDALVPEELEQFLKSLLVTFGIESERGLENFFGFSQSQAEYTTDKTLVYARVLERLITKDREGFDEFVEELRANLRSQRNDGENKITLQRSAETPRDIPTNLSIHKKYLACLEQYLNQATGIEHFSSEELVQAVEAMIEQRSESLKALLRSELAAHGPVSRLVALLPDRLLVQVLSLLDLRSGTQALQYADSIIRACRNMGAVPKSVDIQTLRWCFVFEYFCVQGRSLTVSDFVWRFIDTFRRYTGFTDVQSFYRGLVREVGSNMRLSTRDTQLAILVVMAERVGVEHVDSVAPEQEAQTTCDADSSVRDAPVSDGELVQHLEAYLNEPAKLTAAERADLSKLLEYQLHQPSSRLRDLLQDALGHAQSRNRIIDLLSEAALVRLLAVLGLGRTTELLHCADTTINLLRTLNVGAIATEIESLKWQFICRYLFEESRAFDKPVFIRALLIYLSEQTGVGLSALMQALTEMLTQAIKSGLGTAVSDNLVQVLLAGTVAPATDKTLLYSHVLERFIIQDRDEFDAFADELQGDSRSRGNDGEDKVTLEYANETSYKTPADLRNQSEYLACLEQYLNQAKSLKNISSEELVQALEVMIEQRSESLKSLLHSALVAHRPVSHLVALLPERLLPQVLSLLKVDSGAQALQCADSIVLACRNMELAPDYAELQTLRWCFVFEYFCVQGRAFSASEFIWRFVETLRRQMDFSDEQSFYAGLLHQVGSSLSASTSDVQLTVLAAMVAERSDIEAIESEAEVRAELKAGARAEVKPVVEVGPEAKAGVEAESEGRAQTRIREEAEIRRAASSLSKNRLSEAEFMRSLEAYLNKTAELCAKDWVNLSKSIEIHLQHPSLRLRRFLQDALCQVESRNRLIDLFPEVALVRSLAVLGAHDLGELLRYAESTVNLFRTLGVGAITADMDCLKWQFIACYLFEEDRTFEKQAFIRDLIIYLSEQTETQTSALVQALKLRSDLDNLPEMRRLRQPLLDALTRSESKPNMPPAMKNHSTLGRSNEEELEVSENVYIHNAGLVLVAPYIPRLLEMLNLTADSEFKSRSAAERGIHLLQYLVNRSCSSPEYQLVLNKILCGVTTGTPIVREITMDDNEATVIVSLLQSIIEHWTAIGSTSVAGLQESFLQREGRLRLKNDSWHLLVEARAFDMLLDRLPWSFSLIKFPWMQRPIHVEWR